MPVVPVLSGKGLAVRHGGWPPSVLDAGRVLAASSGSAAIALALRHAGIGPGDRVLLPAFHCRSMVEAVQVTGAEPMFYPVRDDLSVDPVDLRARVDASVRAILATHFFGFMQDMAAIRRLCGDSNVVLIEDCAHAFFGSVGGRPVGSWGDYAIASVRKFFPVYDGGVLVSAFRRVDELALRPAGPAFGMKAALNIAEEAVEYGRARLLRVPLALKRVAWRALKSLLGRRVEDGEGGSEAPRAFRYVDPELIDRRMSLPSRWVMRTCRATEIADRRRANYRRIVVALSGLPGGRPLHRELPEAVIPYMVPFIVDDPDSVFPFLKRQGVPIYRWEDPATAECPVSNRYSRALLQFPCHQSLNEEEMDWMIDCITRALAGAGASQRAGEPT